MAKKSNSAVLALDVIVLLLRAGETGLTIGNLSDDSGYTVGRLRSVLKQYEAVEIVQRYRGRWRIHPNSFSSEYFMKSVDFYMERTNA